eukprot:1159530-Pelagomonas_calceolata.AAC.4
MGEQVACGSVGVLHGKDPPLMIAQAPGAAPWSQPLAPLEHIVSNRIPWGYPLVLANTCLRAHYMLRNSSNIRFAPS